ncbi:MAG: DUF5357 domain-containing protein [Synechococcaceae cyanobacterium RL_1_2]|nr:DUF5357 domain-containing protein [Synechococcaceae cyanobacterium RL_1_2]
MKQFKDFWRTAITTVITLLNPPRGYSWQTMVWLGLFSWGVSGITMLLRPSLGREFVQGLTGWSGWLYLSIALVWLWLEKSLPLAPWVIVLCLYIPATDIFPSGTGLKFLLLIYPILAGILMIIPKFFGENLSSKTLSDQEKYDVILILCLHGLIFCWLYFGLMTDRWRQNLDTLGSFSLRSSPAVVKWGVGSGNLWPNQLLNLMGNDLIDRWHNQPWTEVVGSLTNSNVQQIIDNRVQSLTEKDPSSITPTSPESLQDQVTEIIEDNLPNAPPAKISQSGGSYPPRTRIVDFYPRTPTHPI